MLHATEAVCNRSMVIAALNRAAEPLHANATDAHTDEDWPLLKTGLNWSRRTAQLNHAAYYTAACYTQPKQPATRRLT